MGHEHFRYQVDQEGKGLESTDQDVPILIQRYISHVISMEHCSNTVEAEACSCSEKGEENS